MLRDYYRFNGNDGRDNKDAELYDLTFEKPDYLSQSAFDDIVNDHSWNSEMVIPVRRVGREIKI